MKLRRCLASKELENQKAAEKAAKRATDAERKEQTAMKLDKENSYFASAQAGARAVCMRRS